MFEVVERIEATFSDATSDGMLSDGGGSYEAEIGDFFSLEAKTDVPRKLCFNFHGQLSPAEVGFSDQPDAEVLCNDGYVTTGTAQFQEDNVTPGVSFVDMSIGSVQRARFGGVYVRDGFNWSFKYGRDCELNDVPEERAVITRVSETVWTIEATTMTLCRLPVRGKPVSETVASGLDMPVHVAVERVFVLQ